jgi:hypothetical protein
MEPESSLPHSQRPSTVPILRQLDLAHNPTPYLLKIQLNITIPSMPGSPKWCLSPRFFHQIPVQASPLTIRTTCPTHLIHLDWIFRAILVEQYRSLSPSLWSFLHTPVISSLLGPNISLTPFSQTPLACNSPSISDQVSHPYNTPVRIIV